MRTSPGYTPVLLAATPVHRSGAPALGRTPAAAPSSAPASSGRPRLSHLLQMTRTSAGSSPVVSVSHLDAGDAIPRSSAVFGLAGG